MKAIFVITCVFLLACGTAFAKDTAKELTAQQAIKEIKGRFLGHVQIDGTTPGGTDCKMSVLDLESVFGGLQLVITTSNGKRTSVSISTSNVKVFKSRGDRPLSTKYEVIDESQDPVGSVIMFGNDEDVSDFDLVLGHIANLKTFLTCSFRE